ncbi:hypothetical protein AVEN_187767-1 [Araneus ventricosus]|uniref:Uncharacterized protein n=1 Tax=Araneus ventricosus TaxID=182803 RepID=A0A4Y2C1U5_ARAVE|nr:hypothetical protein AVEN_187767-1 [Araneus ventricosus]
MSSDLQFCERCGILWACFKRHYKKIRTLIPVDDCVHSIHLFDAVREVPMQRHDNHLYHVKNANLDIPLKPTFLSGRLVWLFGTRSTPG